MNDEQFAQQLARARTRPLKPFFAGGAAAAILRGAARRLRETDRVRDELARLLPPSAARSAEIAGWDGETLELRLPDRVEAERVRRSVPGLERALARRVRGLCRVIVAAG